MVLKGDDLEMCVVMLKGINSVLEMFVLIVWQCIYRLYVSSFSFLWFLYAVNGVLSSPSEVYFVCIVLAFWCILVSFMVSHSWFPVWYVKVSCRISLACCTAVWLLNDHCVKIVVVMEIFIVALPSCGLAVAVWGMSPSGCSAFTDAKQQLLQLGLLLPAQPMFLHNGFLAEWG